MSLDFGEANEISGKSNKHREAIFAKSGGMCIYCGGANLATTLDHMPPIVMVRARARPSGLEFPSCIACNNGASAADLVAACIGRIYPDISSKEEEVEITKIMAALQRDVPGFLEELRPPRASEKLMLRRLGVTSGGGLRIDGPIALSHLEAFGARLGFAMHFEATGMLVPPEGGVAVRVYSNTEIFEGKLPEEIFEHLPKPDTLRQGKINVEEQFLYSVIKTDKSQMSMSYASFRQSFALLAFSTNDRTRMHQNGVRMFLPGSLATKNDRVFRSGFSVYGMNWRGWR